MRKAGVHEHIGEELDEMEVLRQKEVQTKITR
jgi:hypothetical protein